MENSRIKVLVDAIINNLNRVSPRGMSEKALYKALTENGKVNFLEIEVYFGLNKLVTERKILFVRHETGAVVFIHLAHDLTEDEYRGKESNCISVMSDEYTRVAITARLLIEYLKKKGKEGTTAHEFSVEANLEIYGFNFRGGTVHEIARSYPNVSFNKKTGKWYLAVYSPKEDDLNSVNPSVQREQVPDMSSLSQRVFKVDILQWVIENVDTVTFVFGDKQIPLSLKMDSVLTKGEFAKEPVLGSSLVTQVILHLADGTETRLPSDGKTYVTLTERNIDS